MPARASSVSVSGWRRGGCGGVPQVPRRIPLVRQRTRIACAGPDRLLLGASPGEPDRRSDTLPDLLRAPELVGLTVIEGKAQDVEPAVLVDLELDERVGQRTEVLGHCGKP